MRRGAANPAVHVSVVGNDDEGGIVEERTRSVPHTPDLLGAYRLFPCYGTYISM